MLSLLRVDSLAHPAEAPQVLPLTNQLNVNVDIYSHKTQKAMSTMKFSAINPSSRQHSDDA